MKPTNIWCFVWDSKNMISLVLARAVNYENWLLSISVIYNQYTLIVICLHNISANAVRWNKICTEIIGLYGSKALMRSRKVLGSKNPSMILLTNKSLHWCVYYCRIKRWLTERISLHTSQKPDQIRQHIELLFSLRICTTLKKKNHQNKKDAEKKEMHSPKNLNNDVCMLFQQ